MSKGAKREERDCSCVPAARMKSGSLTRPPVSLLLITCSSQILILLRLLLLNSSREHLFLSFSLKTRHLRSLHPHTISSHTSVCPFILLSSRVCFLFSSSVCVFETMAIGTTSSSSWASVYFCFCFKSSNHHFLSPSLLSNHTTNRQRKVEARVTGRTGVRPGPGLERGIKHR